MKQVLLLILCPALISLVACSKNSGPMDPKIFNTSHDKPQGFFTSEREVDTEEARKAFGYFCGDSAEPWDFDSRLKTGQVFHQSRMYRLDDGSFVKDVTSQTLVKVDQKKKLIKSRTALRETFKPKFEPTGFESTEDMYWYEDSCTYSREGLAGDMDCSDFLLSPALKANLLQLKERKEPAVRYCYVPWSEDEEVEEIDEYGSYRFQDGRTVTAYRRTKKRTGQLKCQYSFDDEDAKDTGIGTTLEVIISSQDVPAYGYPMSCGGPKDIYRYNKATSESGEILRESSSQLTGGTF